MSLNIVFVNSLLIKPQVMDDKIFIEWNQGTNIPTIADFLLFDCITFVGSPNCTVSNYACFGGWDCPPLPNLEATWGVTVSFRLKNI